MIAQIPSLASRIIARYMLAQAAAEKLGIEGVVTERDLNTVIHDRGWRSFSITEDKRAGKIPTYFRGYALPAYAIGFTRLGVIVHTPESPALNNSRDEVTVIAVTDPDFTVTDYFDRLQKGRRKK